MAIITDATGRQLAQAVGGIDTTGLVKDSTLQATNTELSNIDITGQSIASAISGLGATLGSDKANISGDNIASPSTFRQNIGAQSELIVDTLTGTTGATGNLSLGLSTYNNMVLSAICTSQNDVFLRTWRASQSNLWFITAINPNTGATINSTQLTIKYIYTNI